MNLYNYTFIYFSLFVSSSRRRRRFGAGCRGGAETPATAPPLPLKPTAVAPKNNKNALRQGVLGKGRYLVLLLLLAVVRCCCCSLFVVLLLFLVVVLVALLFLRRGGCGGFLPMRFFVSFVLKFGRPRYWNLELSARLLISHYLSTPNPNFYPQISALGVRRRGHLPRAPRPRLPPKNVLRPRRPKRQLNRRRPNALLVGAALGAAVLAWGA